MCIQQSWIRNKYNGHDYFVKCGHCPACLQEKAIKRANRIRNHMNVYGLPKYDCLFITLTYDNYFVPYISLSETIDFFSGLRPFVYVYRDNESFRFSNRYLSGFRLVPGKHTLALYDDDDFELTKSELDFHLCNLKEKGLPFLRKQIAWKRFEYIQDKVSVCFLPDIQNFFKRLKINLKRYYGYENEVSYCYCSEYGSETNRCHFHVLLYVKRGSFEVAKRAVIKSWPFGDLRRSKRIQRAINPAAYLASYVNASGSVPSFLQLQPFRPFFHFSTHFGLGKEVFSLSSLLDMFNTGTFEYNEQQIREGVLTTSTLSLPTYVLNYYARKFKGFSKLSSAEIQSICAFPWNIYKVRERIEATDDECRAISNHLRTLRARYYQECNQIEKKNYDLPSFAYFYSHVWTRFYSYKLKRLMTEKTDVIDVVENYDNIEDLVNKRGLNQSLTHLLVSTNTLFEIEFDPNYFRANLSRHSRLLQAYESYDKSKKKSNFVLQHFNNYEF